MDVITLSQFFTASSALIGACIGGCASGFVAYRVNEKNHNIEEKSYSAGFIAEVESLQMIIRKRGYLESLQESSSYLSATPGEKISYSILIPDNFSRFYNANLNKVGLLGEKKAKKLVQYHQILQSIVQDFKQDAFFATHGFEKDAIDESIFLFSTALQIGDELIALQEQ